NVEKAGENAQSMADFFETMASQGGSEPPVFFSSHPHSGNRHDAIQKEIADWPAQNYAADNQNFEKVRTHAMGLETYTAQQIQAGAKSGQWATMNQKNGASLNSTGASAFPTQAEAAAMARPSPVSLQNVLPSDNLVNAELGPMNINRPDNWTVTLPEQRGQFVTIAPQAAMIKGDGIGYGVLLNGPAGPQGQRMSIDDLTVALIQKHQEKNELEQLGKPQPITVGAIEGRSTFLRSPSPLPDANGQAQIEKDWLVTVPQSDGSVIFMIFLAPEADFSKFQPTFEAMVKSAQ